MTDEIKQILIDAGRSDLVDAYNIIQSGYAGIMSNGNIVDRRLCEDAAPIPENKIPGIPKPMLIL